MNRIICAEEFIAGNFRDGRIRFDRNALTIHDVGAIKIVTNIDALQQLENVLMETPDITVIECENFSGKNQATNLILEVPWNAEYVCQRYRENRA